MKSSISKGRHITTVILFLLVLSGSFVYFLFLNKNTSYSGKKVKCYKIAKGVSMGQPIKDCIEQSEISSRDDVKESELVLEEKDLDTALASVDLVEKQILTKSLVVPPEEKPDRTIEVAMPVTSQTSSGNDLKVGDIVPVCVNYKDKKDDDCVISAVVITGIKNGSGVDKKDNEAASLVKFKISLAESSKLNNAAKDGVLYYPRYTNLKAPKLKETYKFDNSVDSTTKESGKKGGN